MSLVVKEWRMDMRSISSAVLFSVAMCAGAQTPAVVHPVFPRGEGTALGQAMADVLADPERARAHWGVAVTEMDGTPLYGWNEGQLFRPASNAKLFTTAAAMAMIGPDKRFSTRVFAEGKIEGGKLHGSLFLLGGGDANLAGGYVLPYVAHAKDAPPAPGLADFDALAEQVAAHGIKAIDGDVVGDDSYFENTPYAEGWSTDDLLWGYGAPVGALVAHDNQLDMTATAVAGAELARVVLEPEVPFYTVNAEKRPGFSLRSAATDHNQLLIERDFGTRDFKITGDVGQKPGPAREELAIDAPAEFAATAFRQALLRHGIAVKGSVRAEHWDSGFIGSFREEALRPNPRAQVASQHFFDTQAVSCNETQIATGKKEPVRTLVAEHLSPPLGQDVTLTLKVSQNLHAEVMLRNISAQKDCHSTLRSGVNIVRQYLLHAGLDGDDFFFYDGSGLSTKDVVTPRATIQLLTYAATQPWFADWKAALPVGGVDGSLAGRFKDAPLKGHVFAKTGTLGESRALSGYVECTSGKTVAFAIFVDNHLPGHGEGEAIDKIVAAIAAAY